MPTVDNGKQQTVSLYDGEILTVTATGSGAFVWRLPDTNGAPLPAINPQVVTLGASETKTIGPFDHTTQHKIDASGGPVDFTVSKAPQAKPSGTLASVVTRGLAAKSSGAVMTTSLRDKMKNLAALTKQLPADLEAGVDEALLRIADADKRGVNALAAVHSTLDYVLDGVAATEDAVSMLTNGGPALTPAAPAAKS